MEVHIFDVDHGGCALIRSDADRYILIDCGHNAETGWRPSMFLLSHSINTVGCLFILNFDEDHVSDLPGLLGSVLVPILYRNPSLTPAQILSLKAEHGAGTGVQLLTHMTANHYVAPVLVPPDFGNLIFSTYWNTPQEGFQDSNNLSLVTFFHYHDLHMVFPGDLEERGWLQLMRNPRFLQELATVNVFVASHHGRRDGYCGPLFNVCNPEIVIFSDKSIDHKTQLTAGLYGRHTKGVLFTDGLRRRVLTTRNNGHISIQKTGLAPGWIVIEKK